MTHAKSAEDASKLAIAPSIGSIGTMTGIAMDWTGFSRVQYIVALGVAGAGGLVDAKVQDCDTVGGSYADVSPACALTQVTKAAGDSKTEKLDTPVNPARPFQKIVLVVTTGAFPNSVVGLGYRGSGKMPPTQDAQNVIV